MTNEGLTSSSKEGIPSTPTEVSTLDEMAPIMETEDASEPWNVQTRQGSKDKRKPGGQCGNTRPKPLIVVGMNNDNISNPADIKSKLNYNGGYNIK